MVKSIHLQTLLALLLLGAKDGPIRLSTMELARKIGKSQQAASKHLSELERQRFVERMVENNDSYVKLTHKGVDIMAELQTNLATALEKGHRSHDISGTLFTGLGEGAYYVSLRGYRRQFMNSLGFDPFPGTLNLRLVSKIDRGLRRDLDHHAGVTIEGFDDGERTYGRAKCFRSMVNQKIEGAVLVVERTHYDDSVLEIIASQNIREALNVTDGDLIHVQIETV
jgi:riboflavin kinase